MNAEPDGRLTEQELAVLEHVASAYYAFAALDVYHPADHDEFVFHVHALGRIVMARAAARGHPERGWIKSASAGRAENDAPEKAPAS